MMTDSTSAALLVPTVQRSFTATIAPPGSKSLTNRALVLAALAEGSSTLSNVLFADDTLVMLQGLRELGFELNVNAAAKTVTVIGAAGVIPTDAADLFCGNSGTTIRFLAAMCALGHGTYALDGIARMRQRPIRDLVKLLRDVGATVAHLGDEGFPPLRVSANGLTGGTLAYASVTSSQYLSALLMVSPYARDEVQVDLAANPTSWPYVAMTMRLMDTFGVTPELVRTETGEPQQIVIPPGVYAATNYAVEPDASNAAYFLAAAAIRPGASVTIDGLGSSSLQGDVGVAEVLRQMGASVDLSPHSIRLRGPATLRGIDVDLRDMPDQAQTLAVVALFAAGPTTLRGLHTLRVKETDRLAAMVSELSKFGATVHVENDDMLHIAPPSKLSGDVSIATYDDHRMAMSFAVAGTRVAGVSIENPACVNKTYPEFFADLQRVLGVA